MVKTLHKTQNNIVKLRHNNAFVLFIIYLFFGASMVELNLLNEQLPDTVAGDESTNQDGAHMIENTLGGI